MAKTRIKESQVREIAARMEVDPDALTTLSMVTWGEIIATVLACEQGASGDDEIVTVHPPNPEGSGEPK